ncbi:MAG: class II aldolase/adducin family protein [Paracoccaceae bacterium]|jgi:ribulose-5-phosphate 4-epimerase/fuculose-1-phosphate aldolase|nr:class II aldolase/adducin family protein [Paracoccaceae bacterium]MDG1372165.1 class II aldolase/adducin family protein [Paracoccaceae bacterium]
MNIETKAEIAGHTEEQWQARVDLAAAHRTAVSHGLHEGIFNHLTLRVPGYDDRYYQIPFGTHWAEVTASCFMEVSFNGEVLRGEGIVERSAFCIHAPIHRDVAHAAAVFHTHMPFASALTRLKDQRIKPIGQTELAIAMRTGYDDHYDGPGLDPSEGDRLAKLCGNNQILMMANHGALTLGNNVAEAYDRLYYLERVAQVQIYAMWTGEKLRELPEPVIEKTYEAFRGKTAPKYGDKSTAQWHFEALKRLLDRKEPDYKE